MACIKRVDIVWRNGKINRGTINSLLIDRKSTRLNSSHEWIYDMPTTEIYTLSLHDALPIYKETTYGLHQESGYSLEEWQD